MNAIETPASKEDFSQLMRVLCEAFAMTAEEGEKYRARLGDESFRLVRRNGGVAGGLALFRMGQFFGGRSVRMAGIAAVGVSPDERGKGTATALMNGVVRELHEEGVALSALYPATERLYRRSGYEQAGSLLELQLPLDAIHLNDRELPMRPLTEEDRPLVADIHCRHARRNSGNLDRIDANWTPIWTPRGQEATGYLLGPDDDPQGYILFTQKFVPSEPMLTMFVSDHAFLTPAAGRRLLTFLGDHAAQIPKAFLRVGPGDPLMALVPEQRYRLRVIDHWMLRIVHLSSALTERGFDPGVSVELELDVADDLVEANAGRWVVRIEDGSAQVERGGRGDIQIDIRAFASLYSGHLSVETLRTAGWIDGPEGELARAQAAFAGPAPWMSDSF
jgi:predicted acetyltransferase